MILRKLSRAQYGLLVALLLIIIVLLASIIVALFNRRVEVPPFQAGNPQSSVIPAPKVSLTPEQQKVQTSMISGLQHQQKQEYDQARADYEAAIKVNPTEIGAYNNLGVTYLAQKQWQAAIEPLKKAASLDETYMAAHVNLGLAYCRLGDVTSAKAELATLQKNSIKQIDFLQNLVQGGCKETAS